MSGNTESNVENRFNEDYQDTVDLLKKLGLNNVKLDPQIELLLNLTNDDLQKLDQQVCYGMAYELKKYVIFLKKEENYLKARLIWAEHNLEMLFGKYAKTYGDKFTSYEERKNILRTDNQYAIELNKMVLNMKLKLASIDSLSMQISNLFKILEGLSYAKKNYN
jgi:hypothetical protein